MLLATTIDIYSISIVQYTQGDWPPSKMHPMILPATLCNHIAEYYLESVKIMLSMANSSYHKIVTIILHIKRNASSIWNQVLAVDHVMYIQT